MLSFKTRSQARQFTTKANAMLADAMYKAPSSKDGKGLWNVGFRTGVLTLKKGACLC